MYRGILNHNFIKHFITTNGEKEDVPYRWSHGATDLHMGDGIVVYSLISFLRAKTCVCLGSGGGFIPRIMTQARYDLGTEGIFEESELEWGKNGSTIVVDAMNKVNGEVDWEDKDSFFRKNFFPRVIKDTTENAYYNYFVKQDIKIDYLHIDADHTFDGVKKDFELYSKIINKGGIISIHDTDKVYVDNFIITEDLKDGQNKPEDDLSGPSEFIKTIDKRKFEVLSLFNHGNVQDKPSSSGLTIVRKK
jgi:hypothetical protein